MPTTMRDIARELNLSQATVSKALTGRNSHDIQEETKERVRLAARRMGYQPNHMARSLRSGRSNLISLLIGRVHPAFFSRSIEAFHAQLRESGYDLRIQETVEWTEDQWKAAATDRWQIDGAIVIESIVNLPHLIEAAHGLLPIVSVGTTVIPKIDHVEIDLYPATVAAVRYLQSQGRTRIVYLGHPGVERSSRGLAYAEAVQPSGPPRFLLTRNYRWNVSERECGLNAVKEHLAAGLSFDALLCFNDEMAIGALCALKEHGLRVPQDVALIGCDDIEDTRYHDPAISTLHYPYDEAARLSWEMLRRRIENPKLEEVQSVSLSSTLILRKSSP